jgi:hypothetical protein
MLNIIKTDYSDWPHHSFCWEFEPFWYEPETPFVFDDITLMNDAICDI